jgi:prophage DNA circulation protein
MTFAQRRVAVAALKAVLDALLASEVDAASQGGATLRQLCGALAADAVDQVQAGTFGTPLRACFEAATAGGATFSGMDRVRQEAQSVTVPDLTVQRVAQTAARFALVEIARILAATTFTSRQDVDAALVRVNAAFVPAEDFAASRFNNTVWRALLSLHGTVVRDLNARARPLPRIVPYAFATRMPLLTLTNRLYGDASRADELLAENRDTVHPLFMPASGRALSA